jgi:hypothetical protein
MHPRFAELRAQGRECFREPIAQPLRSGMATPWLISLQLVVVPSIIWLERKSEHRPLLLLALDHHLREPFDDGR